MHNSTIYDVCRDVVGGRVVEDGSYRVTEAGDN